MNTEVRLEQYQAYGDCLKNICHYYYYIEITDVLKLENK